MAATEQQHNLGDISKLYYSLNLVTPVWVEVLGLMSMDPPGFTFGVVDRKLLNGDWKQKRPGKGEGDDGTISLEYSGANAFIQLIATWAQAGRPPMIRFRVTFEDTSEVQWNGFVTSMKGKDVDEDSQVGTDVGYQVAEAPEYYDEPQTGGA